MDAINPDDIRRFMDWKERQKEANRRYRERHAEDIRKRRADFYEENKELVRQKNAEYKRLQRQRDKEKQKDEEKKEEVNVNERGTDRVD
jgi:hypothetical protein